MPTVLVPSTHFQSYVDQASIHPHFDDGSDRCMVVKCDLQDAAVLADKGAHARQMVRNRLRKRRSLTYHSEKDDLVGIPNADRMDGPRLSHEE
eukprot:4543039-Pyramimonas_sp.AAC.1